MQIIYTNYANNYQVSLVDCIIITIIIITVITNVDTFCHCCCYSHLFQLCLGASQEQHPLMLHAEKQLLSQKVSNRPKRKEREERSSGAEHTAGDSASTSICFSGSAGDKSAGEGVGQKAKAGLVWKDSEEGSQGWHFWIFTFLHFSTKTTRVLTSWCAWQMHPLLGSGCVGNPWKVSTQQSCIFLT